MSFMWAGGRRGTKGDRSERMLYLTVNNIEDWNTDKHVRMGLNSDCVEGDQVVSQESEEKEKEGRWFETGEGQAEKLESKAEKNH